MKILCFNVRPRRKSTLVVNLVIGGMLCVLTALSFAGGTLQVFNSSGGEKPIYAGNTASNKISLMVNVYWGDEFIEPMLEVFDAYETKATFFVGGVWASKNSELLNAILERGHELGNHGYYHKDQNKLNAAENLAEISQTHQIVESLTGQTMNLFAPPSGAFNQDTLSCAASLGYKTIMWTRDTVDWRDKDTNLIISRAVKNAKGGDLVLMHPTKNTLEALPEILYILKSKNLQVCSVSETLG